MKTLKDPCYTVDNGITIPVSKVSWVEPVDEIQNERDEVIGYGFSIVVETRRFFVSGSTRQKIEALRNELIDMIETGKVRES